VAVPQDGQKAAPERNVVPQWAQNREDEGMPGAK
jgi:hypothetical protein